MPVVVGNEDEEHAGFYGEFICLHPAFKRPMGHPKYMKRKAGCMEKQGKILIFIFQVCYRGGPHQEKLPQPRRRGRTSALGGKRLK
jgi:hypothetical protein